MVRRTSNEDDPPILEDDHSGGSKEPAWDRRRFLKISIGGVVLVVVAGTTGFELVSHGVLPGQQTLDQLDGACSANNEPLVFSPLGRSMSGTFYSDARNRNVGYTVAYPPAHEPGSALPLVVMLHGFGGNHTDALVGMTPAQAVALHLQGLQLAPMALVTVDGGNGYWNPHPGDDPMGMVIDELIPRCQQLGLGRPPLKIGTMGISMGGYGAILLAEKYPNLISAVAAISPAIWTSYAQANSANAGAFESTEEFKANDVVTLSQALAHTPVRVASGDDDPFHPGVETFVRALPTGSMVEFAHGCHTDPFFLSEEPPSLGFLSRHLAG